MAAGPQRRTTPAPHLSAAAVPVERALLARAQAIEDERIPDGPVETYTTQTIIAAEFRKLADELHWWA